MSTTRKERRNSHLQHSKDEEATEIQVLRAENRALASKNRAPEVENTVLKRRQAQFDPLFDPILQLPDELKSMVHDRALRVHQVVGVTELAAFLHLEPPPVPGGLQIPFAKRSQYFKAFLQNNTVSVTGLCQTEKQFDQYKHETGIDITLENSNRSLHLTLTENTLHMPRKPRDEANATCEQDVLRSCPKTQDLTISIHILPFRPLLGDANAIGSTTMEDAGYQGALMTLRKLKSLHVHVDTKFWAWDGVLCPGVQRTKEQCTTLKNSIAEIVKQASPECQMEWTAGPAWFADQQ